MDFLINVLIALGVMTVLGGIAGCIAGGITAKKKKTQSTTKKEVIPEGNFRAYVKCAGGNISKRRYTLDGTADCAIADSLYGGMTECRNACLGLGSCINACALRAISVKGGVAVVDPSLCDGCGACIGACPRSVIALLPASATVKVACKSAESATELSEICDIGCIGCNICVNTCEYGAIKVENNIAKIDYENCTLCGACSKACPRGIIIAPNVPAEEEYVQEALFEDSEEQSETVAPTPIEE